MNAISRRNVVRSAGALFALPFAGALLPAHASGQTELDSTSQTNKLRLSRTAATAVSLDLVNFVKDHSARALAASYRAEAGGYSALGDQFHMLGKHLSLAGADKAVKAQCRKFLKAGTFPTIDSQAVAHAVSCVQSYAPSFSAKQLLSSNAIPSTAQEWSMHLKKLKKTGLVKYCHRAARQLNAMDHAHQNQAFKLSQPATEGSYKPATFDATQTAHVVDICSLSQKEKFFICIGATVAAGLVVLAVVVAVCGATALAACFGGGTLAAVYIAGFGLLTASILAACTAYLASYRVKSRLSAAPSAI